MTDTPAMAPARVVLQMIMGAWVSQAIHVVASLGVADLLRDGPRTRFELADATSADASSLYRVLRLLISLGLFTEGEDGRISLTPLAEPLRNDAPDSLRAYAIHQGGEANRRAIANLLHSVKTGEPAFDHVFGMGAFEYFRTHPAEGERFNAAMTSRSRQENDAVLSAYSFAEIRAIVDIGGGHGTLLAAILHAYPSAHGVLLDRPAVVEGARIAFEGDGLAARCEFVAGDFFEAVPLGADAHLLKRVIHDWGDEQSLAILSTCRRAIPRGGRLLLIEHVIAPGSQPSEGKLLDLVMLATTHGGRERTEAEFRELLARAGFSLQRVIPTPAGISVLESVPV